MKYGIKHNNGKIEALTRFTDEVLVGFIEITKAKYEEFVEILSTNVFVTYDDAQNIMVIDQAQEAQLIDDFEKNQLKEQLRTLSVEIDVLQKMGDSITAVQNEFDAVLIAYRNKS